jgi:hypothetical protein
MGIFVFEGLDPPVEVAARPEEEALELGADVDRCLGEMASSVDHGSGGGGVVGSFGLDSSASSVPTLPPSMTESAAPKLGIDI